MTKGPQASDLAEPAEVLSRAVVRAADHLGLRQMQMARILGLSPATASRLSSGSWQLAPESKAWELALAFVRLYRSLAALTGGETQAMRDWLHSGNDALGAVPSERMLTAEGLISVLHYLDARRAPV